MTVNQEPQQPPSSQLLPPAISPAPATSAPASAAESALAHSSAPTTPSALTTPATAAGVNASAKASLPDLVANLTAKHNDNQRRAAAWWALLQHLRALETAVPAAPLTPLDKPTLAAVLDCFCKDVLIAPSADAAAAPLEPTMILPQCAMRAGAYCLYRIQLLANASPEQLRAVFRAIISVLTNSTDGKMVYLAVWSLAIHRAEPVDFLQDMSEELVEGLMRSLNFVDATEAFMKDLLAALHRLFKKLPEVCLEQSTIWFPHVFPLLLSSDAKTVEYANSFFPPVVEHFIALRKDYAAQIKRLTESQLMPAIELMQANMTHKNVFTAWGHFVASLGANLHRTPGFNAILKIVESGFNSPVDAKRIAAHKAWRRLILNFAHDGHLRTPKRTALLLLPIVNAFRHEKLALARQECAASYVFLLVHLSRFPPARGLIKASLLPAVAAIMQPDQNTIAKTVADGRENDDGETLDDVVSAIACFAGGDGSDSTTAAIAPPDLSKSFAEIDGRAKMFRRRVRACLPSRVWDEEDFAAVLAIVGMAAGRCIADPKFRERAMPLWEGVVSYIDRAVAPPNFNLGALVEGLNTLWNILQRPDAQDHAQSLASVFAIPALKRLHEASAEHQRAQFDRAKQATKCASNLRRMMASGSRAQELMTAVISCITKQYQNALAPGDSLAGRPHQRAQSIMDKLSSPHKPRANAGVEENSSPRRGRANGNASTAHAPVHFFPVSEKKRKTLDANDEEVLTPKQMEKRRQLDNIPFKMYNALDRTQSQANPAASLLEDIDGNHENINNSDDENHNTDLAAAAAAAAAHSDDTPPSSYPTAPLRQPTAHDENHHHAAGMPHVPAAAGASQSSHLHLAPPPPPPQSQSIAFERPRVNTMPPPLSLMASENNNNPPTSSFAAAVELLKARTGDLAKMHPRELMRVHISLHNVIGELIRVANASVTALPPRPE